MRDEITERLGDELVINITSPAGDAAENRAVTTLLAETLDCPRSEVQIVSGQTSCYKIIWLVGKSEAGVLAKLW